MHFGGRKFNERDITVRNYTRSVGIATHEAEFEEAETARLQWSFNRIALARRPKYTTWKACLYFILNPIVSTSTAGTRFTFLMKITS